jgi:hypothetical protein
MEVIVATVIAAIAVVGLAHMFGMGRGQIDRFATARIALGVAEEQMAILSVLPRTHPDLELNTQHDSSFVVDGQAIGDMRWIVTPVRFDWTSGVPYSDSLRRIVVEVNWAVTLPDTIRLTRLFQK